MIYCLFCEDPVKDRVEPDKNVVCSTCVTMLLRATQDELYDGYVKAKELLYDNKVLAIKSFLKEETINARSKDHGLSNGSRGNGLSRTDRSKTAKQSKAKSRSSLHKGDKNPKNVFRSRSSKLAGRDT